MLSMAQPWMQRKGGQRAYLWCAAHRTAAAQWHSVIPHSHPQQVGGICLADQHVHQAAAALEVGQAVPSDTACRNAQSGVPPS